MPRLPSSLAILAVRLRAVKWPAFVRVLLPPVCTLFFIALIGASLYWRSQSLMQVHLREYLRATAAVSALQFDGDAIAALDTKTALKEKTYKSIVKRLNDIRNQIPTIRYAYIMGKTDDPSTLVFLADADSLSSDADLDVNKNGEVEDDELPSYPGDMYDVTEVPALQGPAFMEPTVDTFITEDEWGRLISGYAPIRNRKGKVVGVLGLDMEADAFEELSRSVFSWDALLVTVLGGGMLALYTAFELRKRRLDASAQLEKERHDLMELASHQLGGPLTTFKWWLEILREQDNGKLCRDTDVCNQMEEGIKRMDAIIKALRTAEASQSLHQHTSCDVKEVASNALKEAHVHLLHRKQKCEINIPDNLPQAHIDDTLLDGVLEELLENASAYSKEDMTIVISAELRGKEILVSVKDTGDGISAEELSKVTQKFVRGKSAYSRKPVGNGLGLWIIRSIIERAGGKLWIESQLGKGTTVHFTLPIVE